ncbi:MAG TPA: transporter substrate-binding domain-containing protein [Azospirillaceae bacterium]|nr:transporter substrate-binding domain-containing protein [Azospirillaceae bacterium]
MPLRLRHLLTLLGVVLGCALGPGGVGQARAADVLIVSDPWCPYACDPSGGQDGYMIDIAREVYKDAGLTVEYRLVNFQVMKRMILDGSADAVPGASTDMDGALLLPRVAQGRSANGVAVRSDSRFAYEGPESFLPHKLAVVRDYNYGKAIQAYIDTHKHNPARIETLAGYGYSQVPQGLRLVAAGGADLFIDDQNVLLWNLARLQMARNIRVVSLRDDADLFIGFSKKAPKGAERMRILEQGIEKLRADGRLSRILAVYGLTDWK